MFKKKPNIPPPPKPPNLGQLEEDLNNTSHDDVVMLLKQRVVVATMELKQTSQSPHNMQQTKRITKVVEDNVWDCSVCTYRNTAEAFKCLMCDIRKGTSTRKPRINPQLVAQQVAQQYSPTPPKTSKRDSKDEAKDGSGRPEKKSRATEKGGKRTWGPPRLKNIDRSTGESLDITVDNVTVTVTEYQPKARKSVLDFSGQSSSAASENGSQSESSNDANTGDTAAE